MDDAEALRVSFRREVHAVKTQVTGLIGRLGPGYPAAARALRLAQNDLFAAWTLLCTHDEDEDEDH